MYGNTLFSTNFWITKAQGKKLWKFLEAVGAVRLRTSKNSGVSEGSLSQNAEIIVDKGVHWKPHNSCATWSTNNDLRIRLFLKIKGKKIQTQVNTAKSRTLLHQGAYQNNAQPFFRGRILVLESQQYESFTMSTTKSKTVTATIK